MVITWSSATDAWSFTAYNTSTDCSGPVFSFASASSTATCASQVLGGTAVQARASCVAPGSLPQTAAAHPKATVTLYNDASSSGDCSDTSTSYDVTLATDVCTPQGREQAEQL